MANPQSEPTMDEILASIRRIISEEDDVPAASGSSLEPLTLDESNSISIDEDPLIEEVVTAPEAVAAEESTPQESPESSIEPELEAVSADTEPVAETIQPDPLDDIIAPNPEPAVTEKRPIDYDAISDTARKAATQSMAAQGLVGDQAARKVSEAFGTLEENVRVSNAAGQTIEDIVQAMLRPMIHDWLDANLPRIVEEKVEEEVRRIARRR